MLDARARTDGRPAGWTGARTAHRTTGSSRPGRGPRTGGAPLRRLLARPSLRRAAAALLLAVAAGVGLEAVRPPAPPAPPALLVAAADLPAGHVLGPGDVARARVPVDVAPAGALGPGDLAVVVDARLPAAVRAGEVLTDARLGGPGLLVGAPPGRVAVVVPLAGPGGDLVRAGDAVDVLAPPAVDVAGAWSADPAAEDLGGATGPGLGAGTAPGSGVPAAAVVAAGAVVLEVPAPQAGGGLVPTGAAGGGVVVLAVTPAEARAVAAVTTTGGTPALALLPP